MPSEVAPPMANEQQKLEKPMTGVGDRPLTDDSAKSDTAGSGNPTAASDNSGNRASEKPPSGNEASAASQPPPSKNIQPDNAGTAEAAPPSSRKSRSETKRADRISDSAGLAPPASNPAEDSLYLEGQKYLYGGHGVRQNCTLARQNLLAAAKNDNSKAESTLGTMYATGHCVPRDIPLAYRWFAQALHSDPRNTRLEKDAEIMWNQMTPPERQLALRNQ
jgi:TPR repeat protein